MIIIIIILILVALALHHLLNGYNFFCQLLKRTFHMIIKTKCGLYFAFYIR